MLTRIQKWGNGLGLRIPRSLAEAAGVVAGSVVDLSIRRDDLVVKTVKRRQYRLEELLRQITSSNIHAEVDVGAPAGSEML
jgi:antitoxin MazE